MYHHTMAKRHGLLCLNRSCFMHYIALQYLKVNIARLLPYLFFLYVQLCVQAIPVLQEQEHPITKTNACHWDYVLCEQAQGV